MTLQRAYTLSAVRREGEGIGVSHCSLSERPIPTATRVSAIMAERPTGTGGIRAGDPRDVDDRRQGRPAQTTRKLTRNLKKSNTECLAEARQH